jgi:general nucleoside transport system permease protein
MRKAPLLVAIFVAVGTAVVSGAFVLAAGASPPAVLYALLDGAFLTRASFGETLTRTTPILLTALGAVVALRAGVLNIGLEGQFLAGAAAAAAAGAWLPGSPAAILAGAVVAAIVAGAAAILPALWLFERRNVPVVLSTILLNLVAVAHVSWLVRGPLRDPLGDYPQSPAVADAVRLVPLMAGSRATVAVPLAFLLAIAIWFLVAWTRWGLWLRAVGESPRAARSAGVPDLSVRRIAFAVSGALAGLGGGLEVLGVTGRLYDPFSAGTGYTGIAAALLGGLHPAGTAAASLALAGLTAGSGAMQRDAGLPAAISSIVPALAVMAVLAAKGSFRREA